MVAEYFSSLRMTFRLASLFSYRPPSRDSNMHNINSSQVSTTVYGSAQASAGLARTFAGLSAQNIAIVTKYNIEGYKMPEEEMDARAAYRSVFMVFH